MMCYIFRCLMLNESFTMPCKSREAFFVMSSSRAASQSSTPTAAEGRSRGALANIAAATDKSRSDPELGFTPQHTYPLMQHACFRMIASGSCFACFRMIAAGCCFGTQTYITCFLVACFYKRTYMFKIQRYKVVTMKN